MEAIRERNQILEEENANFNQEVSHLKDECQSLQEEIKIVKVQSKKNFLIIIELFKLKDEHAETVTKQEVEQKVEKETRQQELARADEQIQVATKEKMEIQEQYVRKEKVRNS